MTVITISRELGSRGTRIAESVAAALGTTCIDKEVLAEMARQSGVSVEVIVEAEERLLSQPRVISREMQRFFSADPRNRAGAIDQATYVTQMTEAIRFLASQGDVIFVGRGAQVILAEHPGALHVHLYADPAVRAARIQRRRALPQIETARHIIDQADRSRREWFRRFFTGVDWKNPNHYHLLIDTGRIAEDTAVALIVQAAQAQPAID